MADKNRETQRRRLGGDYLPDGPGGLQNVRWARGAEIEWKRGEILCR
jgi:hypothetical protein